MHDWERWQHDVVALLRTEFEVLELKLSVDDVDWPEWRAYYAQGRTPRAAIERALERDL